MSCKRNVDSLVRNVLPYEVQVRNRVGACVRAVLAGGGVVAPVQPSPQPVAPGGTDDYPAPDALYWLDGDTDDETAGGRDLVSTAGIFYGPLGVIPRNPSVGFTGLTFWNDDISAGSAARTNTDCNIFNTGGDITICALINNTEPNETVNGYVNIVGDQVAARCQADAAVDSMKPNFEYTQVSTALVSVTCPAAIIMDAWSFVIIRRTVDPGVDCDVDFFLNGEKFSVPAQPEPFAMTSPIPGAKIELLRGSSSSNEMNGGVSNVGIWLSALTDAECLALYESVAPWYLT